MAISTTIAHAFANGTVSNAALELSDAPFSFSAANIDKADKAVISVDTQPVRFRYDGGVPTAAVGLYLAIGDKWVVEGNQNIRNLQFIRATGTDGFVAITLESFQS